MRHDKVRPGNYGRMNAKKAILAAENWVSETVFEKKDIANFVWVILNIWTVAMDGFSRSWNKDLPKLTLRTA